MVSALSIPGTICRLGTWPEWEIDGRPAPHPVIVIRRFENGLSVLAPITHSKSLCKSYVELNSAEYPNAVLPIGPLNNPPDISYICLRNKLGFVATATVETGDFHVVFRGQFQIPTRATYISSVGDKWPTLLERIRQVLN